MVKDKKENNDTKQKILSAAEDIFFEKGFDGSRVDEIAKRAEVNKASIYYYFESKDQILDAVFEKNKNDILERKKRFIREEELANKSTDEMLLEIIKGNAFYDLIYDKKKFFTILLIETLKNSSNNMAFFKIISEIYNVSLPVSALSFPSDEIKIDLTTKIFFFVTMPGIICLVMGEKWADYNSMNLSNEKLMDKFVGNFKEVLLLLMPHYEKYLEEKK